MVVDFALADYTQPFEQSFEVLTCLQEDPNLQSLDIEVCELQKCYDEFKGTA